MAHLAANKQQLINRVRRIAGQVEAIERALTEDADCSVTLQRVAAARGAINDTVGHSALMIDVMRQLVPAR
jgi:DNA-binding FrmR family transcriptional regulator